MITFWFKKR